VLLSVSGSAGQEAATRTLEGRLAGRVVFVSTTGVYGENSGALGLSGPFGASDRARAAQGAESAARDLGAVIVRLGGLYKENRGPAAAFRRTLQAPPGPGGRTLPLVHEEDAVTALDAALRHKNPRPVYIAVTPPLPTRAEFYGALAANLGVATPLLGEGGEPSSYDIEGLRADLLATPAHPDWREILPTTILQP